MIMMILFMCIWRVKSMYYILLLSQMSKLQIWSESKYAAIFQLNSLPGKILFLSFRLGFLGGEIGKKGGYFGLGMGPILGPWW